MSAFSAAAADEDGDTIDELRTAVQQACDWISKPPGQRPISAGRLLAILTNTLAAAPPVVKQPQIDWQDMYLKEKRRAEMWIAKYEQDIGKLERVVPAAQQKVQQELPSVAKIVGMDEYGPMLLWHQAWTDFPVGTKIYTHPQPLHKPLTDEQIDKALERVNRCALTPKGIKRAEARAVERAHGIKEDT